MSLTLNVTFSTKIFFRRSLWMGFMLFVFGFHGFSLSQVATDRSALASRTQKKNMVSRNLFDGCVHGKMFGGRLVKISRWIRPSIMFLSASLDTSLQSFALIEKNRNNNKKPNRAKYLTRNKNDDWIHRNWKTQPSNGDQQTGCWTGSVVIKTNLFVIRSNDEVLLIDQSQQQEQQQITARVNNIFYFSTFVASAFSHLSNAAWPEP